MEQINMETGTIEIEQFKQFVVEEEKTVKAMLAEIGLEDMALAVLVDGMKVEMDDVIKEGQKVVILPKIAGG